MTPELRTDIRACALYVWQGTWIHTGTEHDVALRVLAWCDVQEQPIPSIDLSQVCDAAGIEMLDAEYTEGDFLG